MSETPASQNPDWRAMYEREFIGAWDLERDIVLVIQGVAAGELRGEKNKVDKRPIVSFRGTKKKFALNKTNGKTIAQLYGNDTRAWVGKAITLYATTTTFGRETVDCVRVRPVVPQPKQRAPQASDSSEAPQ